MSKELHSYNIFLLCFIHSEKQFPLGLTVYNSSHKSETHRSNCVGYSNKQRPANRVLSPHPPQKKGHQKRKRPWAGVGFPISLLPNNYKRKECEKLAGPNPLELCIQSRKLNSKVKRGKWMWQMIFNLMCVLNSTWWKDQSISFPHSISILFCGFSLSCVPSSWIELSRNLSKINSRTGKHSLIQLSVLFIIISFP